MLIFKLKQIFSRFKKEDQTDLSLIERSKSEELCEWSNKVLIYNYCF